MVTKEYKTAAAEVNKVLSYLPVEEVQMIPEDLRNFLNEIEDKDAVININPCMISLYDQAVSQKAKEILAMIYTYYFAELEDLPDIEPEIIKEANKAYSEIKSQAASTNREENKEEEKIKESKENSISVVPKVPWYKKLLSWLKLK